MEGALRTTFDQPDPVPPSQAPTAVAGATPTTVPEGGVVQLDGSGSSDPENGALRYAWTQITKLYVGLSSASSDSPSFTAPRGLPMPEPRFLVDGHRHNRRRLQAKHGRGARDLLAAHRQRSIRSRADRPGDLRWRASSSDDTVATVRVVEQDLLVEPALASEGRAESSWWPPTRLI